MFEAPVRSVSGYRYPFCSSLMVDGPSPETTPVTQPYNPTTAWCRIFERTSVHRSTYSVRCHHARERDRLFQRNKRCASSALNAFAPTPISFLALSDVVRRSGECQQPNTPSCRNPSPRASSHYPMTLCLRSAVERPCAALQRPRTLRAAARRYCLLSWALRERASHWM